MDNNTLVMILVVLVILSAFFSATETAFSSLNKIKLKNLANDGNKKASKALELSERFQSVLSTILVGNNIVNILMTSLSTILFVKMLNDENLGVTYSTAVMTIVVLIFGEITPKSIAKQMPEKFAMSVCGIIGFLTTLLTPINLLFEGLQKLIALIFKFEDADDSYSAEELVTIVEEAQNEGDMDDHEADLITNAIEFNDLEVGEIFTPRVDVIAIDVDDPEDEIDLKFRENGYSRLPVYEGNIDNIIGVLHEKEFYFNYYNQSGTTIKQILQSVHYTSPQVKISSLLRQLQSNKSHMAIVIDEYGGTAGIITMEDILEELVGEIYDEHDEVEEFFKKVDENVYLVDCDADIEDTFEFLGVTMKEEYDFVTTSGWVIHNCDCIPNIGAEFDFENLHVVVTDADNKVVKQIRVEVNEKQDDEEE